MKLYYKSFFIIIFFTFLLLFFNSNVFGATLTIDNNNYTIPGDNVPEYYIIFEYNNTKFFVSGEGANWCVFPYDGKYYISNFISEDYTNPTSNNNRYALNYCSTTLDSYVFPGYSGWHDRGIIISDNSSIELSDIPIIASSVDIHDNSGTVFFPIPVQGIIAQELAPVEMREVLNQVLVVLPLILVLVVSLVGFRKGLQMLSKLLHQV